VWRWQTSGNGDIGVLRAALFLRAWTPARLRTDSSRAASLGEVGPATGMVARLPTWQMVMAQTHKAMRRYHRRWQGHSMHVGLTCPQLKMVLTPRRGVRKPVLTAGKMPAAHSVQTAKHGLCICSPQRLTVRSRKPKTYYRLGLNSTLQTGRHPAHVELRRRWARRYNCRHLCPAHTMRLRSAVL